MSGVGEQRKYPRVPVRQGVWCEHDTITLYVEALNASRDGMLLRTSSHHLRGTTFRISFTDPTSREEVIATAEAVWCQNASDRGRPQLGLRITGFEKGSDKYAAFVARHYDDVLDHTFN